MAFVSMPRQDLLEGIKSLAEEKNIDREIVFESLEMAIAKIAKAEQEVNRIVRLSEEREKKKQ